MRIVFNGITVILMQAWSKSKTCDTPNSPHGPPAKSPIPRDICFCYQGIRATRADRLQEGEGRLRDILCIMFTRHKKTFLTPSTAS